jgi:hypothetical protein
MTHLALQPLLLARSALTSGDGMLAAGTLTLQNIAANWSEHRGSCFMLLG